MLEDDQEKFRGHARRRLITLGGLGLAVFTTLSGRLFHLQILRGGAYRDLAENNRLSFYPIPAPRGRIFDRFGKVLVENSPDYQLMIIPELAGSLKDVLFNLQDYLGLDNKEIQMILKQAKRQRSFLPIKVKSHLEWPVVSRLESRIYRFPGTMIQVQSLRHYPYAGLAAHVLGYL
ncbi:penicillin-binding protein 2, partial [Magnetococcales bacterium HHB-1]